MHQARSSVFIVITAALLAFCIVPARSQTSGEIKAVPAAGEAPLIAAAEAEEKLGTYVLYTQSFLDQQNKWATYKGSVFAGLMALKVTDCEIRLSVVVQDIFTGEIGKKPTGHQTDTSNYTVSFTLDREIADDLKLKEAPPAQLESNTRPICAEKRACAFEWVVLESKSPVFSEARVLNGFLDFNGPVNRFEIPVSSTEMGQRLIAAVKSLSVGRCP